ncbi:flagellum-secreted nonflagellar protein FspA2, partial [Campylobacter jejuni]
KNFSNYQTQINKDNDLVSNVRSDNVVKIQISDEARSLSQANSKNEKEYEIKVSQEKIENHKDQNSIQSSKGGGNPALEALIAKLAEILAKIAELTQKMTNANEQMKTTFQKQIDVLKSQADVIQAQIQELQSQQA